MMDCYHEIWSVLGPIVGAVIAYVTTWANNKNQREMENDRRVFEAKARDKEEIKRKKIELYMTFISEARVEYNREDVEEMQKISRICDAICLVGSQEVVDRIEIYKNATLGDYSINFFGDPEKCFEYSNLDLVGLTSIYDLAIKAMRNDVREYDI